MDEPICRRPRDKTVREADTLYLTYLYAVWRDDKDEFLRLIKDPESQLSTRHLGVYTIFATDALDIGIAVLNGETDGIIDLKDTLSDGMTPLHYAAIMGAPSLTNYLLERGDNVDSTCDYKCTSFYLKQATPLHLTLEAIACSGKRKSLHDLLFWLCHHNRHRLETVRLLIKNTQNKEWVRKAFIDYADKGQLAALGVLFLAAPHLFLSTIFESVGGGLSSFAMPYLGLNSPEKRTRVEEELFLLLDVLAMVGDKLVAYVRLEETSDQIVQQTQMEIDFLLREVASKKLGVSSLDYYFRFFNPERPEVEQLSSLDLDLPEETSDDDVQTVFGSREPGPWMFSFLHHALMEKDANKDDIYRQLPILEPDDVDRLNKAIEKKLLSMLTSSEGREDMTIISKQTEKQLPQWLPFLARRKFEPIVRRFSAIGAFKHAPTNSWENKVMKPKKLKSVFSALVLSHFPKVVKRLIK